MRLEGKAAVVSGVAHAPGRVRAECAASGPERSVETKDERAHAPDRMLSGGVWDDHRVNMKKECDP